HQIRVIFSLLCRTIVVKRLKLTPEKRSGGILRSQVDFPPFSGVSEWYRTAVQTAPGRDCRERNVTPPHQGDGRTVQVGIQPPRTSPPDVRVKLTTCCFISCVMRRSRFQTRLFAITSFSHVRYQ